MKLRTKWMVLIALAIVALVYGITTDWRSVAFAAACLLIPLGVGYSLKREIEEDDDTP